MRAYTLSSYGPDGLTLTETAEPALRAGGVKIRIERIAINPLDWKIRDGYFAQMLPLRLPAVIGSDVAGTVLGVGDDVLDLEVGDQVVGFADSGAFAAVAVTRRARVTKVPAGLDLTSGAALATSAETAQRVLGMIDLAPSSTVVVNGAAGSVGSAVTQLLVARGHHVVGTASAANRDYLASLGATPVGYGDAMIEELRVAAQRGIHAAFDTTGHDFVARTAGLISPDRVVTIADFAAGARGAVVAAGDPTQLMAGTIGAVLERAAAGRFVVHVDEVFPFERLAEALDKSEAGHVRGKLVVMGATTEEP
jgi:NADPH:quinone reductase-like Zn-dependent oxidoreductase